MSSSVNFQDWEQVVIRKSKPPIKQEPNKTFYKHSLDSNEESPPQQNKVTNNLISKIKDLRISIAKQNQETFAASIGVKPIFIKEIENGKMSLKDAKQIILKMERKFKVKIL